MRQTLIGLALGAALGFAPQATGIARDRCVAQAFGNIGVPCLLLLRPLLALP